MTLSAHRGFSLQAAALVLLVMVGGCSNSSTGVSAGDKAPDFVLPRLDGTVQKLSNYRGQVVLVNFWATWCPPCIEEMQTSLKKSRSISRFCTIPAGRSVLSTELRDIPRRS